MKEKEEELKDKVDFEILEKKIDENLEVNKKMTNEWIVEQLKIAKEALDRVPQLGEDGYNLCDGILTNLKTFVTEDEVYKKIIAFEDKIFRDFKRKEREAREKLKGIDYLTSFSLGRNFYISLRQWKSTELLNLWTRLSKDYDL